MGVHPERFFVVRDGLVDHAYAEVGIAQIFIGGVLLDVSYALLDDQDGLGVPAEHVECRRLIVDDVCGECLCLAGALQFV